MSEQTDTLEVLLQHYGWQGLSVEMSASEQVEQPEEVSPEFDTFERRAS
jgi:hypothetical protein